MRKVEARRLKLGLSKKELAAELGTTSDAVRNWLTGRTVGRKETVAKVKAHVAAGERVGAMPGRLIKD
jgi:DNA-binding transcriptional regulator YiaG